MLFSKKPMAALISLTGIGILIAYTNATTQQIQFDLQNMQCRGTNERGTEVIGIIKDSKTFIDCGRTTNLPIDLAQNNLVFRGAEIINSRLSGQNSSGFEASGTNFFGLNADNAKVSEIDARNSAFFDSTFTDTNFNSGQFINSKFVGTSKERMTLLNRVEMRKISFSETEFKVVKFEDFTGHDLIFSATSFEDSYFSKAKLFNMTVVNGSVCGDVDFAEAYFSRSALKLFESAQCARETVLSFSKANLRGNTLNVNLRARSRAIFDGADLRGADLSGLNVSSGQWSFQNATADASTRFPKGFDVYTQQIKFEKVATAGGGK